MPKVKVDLSACEYNTSRVAISLHCYWYVKRVAYNMLFQPICDRRLVEFTHFTTRYNETALSRHETVRLTFFTEVYTTRLFLFRDKQSYFIAYNITSEKLVLLVDQNLPYSIIIHNQLRQSPSQ